MCVAAKVAGKAYAFRQVGFPPSIDNILNAAVEVKTRSFVARSFRLAKDLAIELAVA